MNLFQTERRQIGNDFFRRITFQVIVRTLSMDSVSFKADVVRYYKVKIVFQLH